MTFDRFFDGYVPINLQCVQRSFKATLYMDFGLVYFGDFFTDSDSTYGKSPLNPAFGEYVDFFPPPKAQ